MGKGRPKSDKAGPQVCFNGGKHERIENGLLSHALETGILQGPSRNEARPFTWETDRERDREARKNQEMIARAEKEQANLLKMKEREHKKAQANLAKAARAKVVSTTVCIFLISWKLLSAIWVYLMQSRALSNKASALQISLHSH